MLVIFLCFPGSTTELSYDYSSVDYTEYHHPCNKTTLINVGSIAIPVVFSFVVLLSLVGNGLVLAILARYENLRSLTNIFILNLALSDLIFTLGLPFWSSYYLWGWTLGTEGCKGVSFVFYVGFYSSILFLMLMTIQRYVAVVHPLSDWETGQRFAAIPILAWVVSIAAAVPVLLFSEKQKAQEDSTDFHCEFNPDTGKFDTRHQQNIFFVVAFLIMGFCYIRILLAVFKRRTRKKHRTVRLIFCIVAVFFVGWAPYNIVIFLKSIITEPCEVSTRLDYAYYVSKMLAFSHCCLNPVFYVFIGVKFRNHLKGILQKIFRRRSNMDPRSRITSVQSQGSMYSENTENCGRKFPR
ncbi:chemokine XC receptor 1-like [Astyanax mexicanus]|uniref:Chemokine XC receptor 1-like n=1 Tax=Astyanax mexicanus TaxID=7994 RepID=A0A8T2LIP4_ASTMX|nr:chemokine XC receptor 1-like [Astyanax mexicanus]